MPKTLVLHAVPNLSRSAGGIAAILPPLCKALHGVGVESRFLTLQADKGNPLAHVTQILNERTIFQLKKRVRAEVGHWSAQAHSAGQNFVCHSHGLWDFLNHSLVAAARREREDLIVSLHGMLLPWARRHKSLRKDIAWGLYQKRDILSSSIVHVTSDAELIEAEKLGIKGPFAVIPFGVEIPDTFLSQKRDTDARKLLFLGRLHPIKNLAALIEAFAAADVPGWILMISGPDEVGHRAELESLAAALGISERVCFGSAIYAEAKSSMFLKANLFILPSHSENYGLVVAEALAHGVPVIATTGSPWSLLQREGIGWWVPPDTESLTAVLRESLSQPEAVLASMGVRGREYMKDNISWATAASKLAERYHFMAKS